jgi:hypothetical protein
MQDEARVLWDLVFTARFDITRALALAKLSMIDPEGFKKIRDVVNSSDSTKMLSEDLK